MCDETNAYASSARVLKGTSRRWKPLEPKCLLASVGIVVYMGIVKLPTRKMYWERARGLGMPEIYSCMILERFCDIARMLHFEKFDPTAPQKGEPGYDKVRTIHIVLECFRSARQFNWKFGRYLSVLMTQCKK